MKRSIIASYLAFSVASMVFSSTAHAGKRVEICESGDVVPGKGWVYTRYPCPVDADEVAKEKACGKDYGELRVGMTIKRVEQCLEALSYETEKVGQGGKVEIYSSTFYWIQAKNGKVISYTRRTN